MRKKQSRTYLSLAIIAFILTYANVQSQVIVSDPTIVADQDTYGNLRPRVISDSNGDPIIVWSDSDTHHIYATHMMGGSFMDPVQLNPDASSAAVYDWYGPDLAINGNDVYVVYKELPESSGDIFLVHSADAGMTWGNPVLVNSSDDPVPRMPDVAVGDDGTVYVTFMYENYDTMATEWMLTKSEDQGQSFSEPISATSSVVETVCDCCPAELLVYNNYVAIVYRNNDDNLRDIRAALSLDYGNSFDTFIDLDPLDWEIDACPATGPNAVATWEGIQSVWMSDASGDSRVYFSQHGFYPGSDTSALELHIVESNETQNYPSLAIDDGAGLVAWEVNTSGQRNIAITWTFSDFDVQEYMVITLDESGNQQRPHLALAGDLEFHLVYTDNGGDAVIYRSVNTYYNVDDLNSNPLAFSYPNPSAESVTIILSDKITQAGKYVLFDTQGREVHSSLISGNTKKIQLDMHDLEDGVYMLHITFPNHQTNLRLVKSGAE